MAGVVALLPVLPGGALESALVLACVLGLIVASLALSRLPAVLPALAYTLSSAPLVAGLTGASWGGYYGQVLVGGTCEAVVC